MTDHEDNTCTKCPTCARKNRTEKKCTGCHEVKNISDFYLVNNKIGYKKSKCKTCENKYRGTLYVKKGKKTAWHEREPELLQRIIYTFEKTQKPREILEKLPMVKMHMIQYVKKIMKE
jgi:hypothetical protein